MNDERESEQELDEIEEEQEEEEEEEEKRAAAPPPPPPPQPAPKPAVKKTRGRTPAQVHAGVGATASMNAPFRNTDAIQLWGEVLDRLRQYPQLGTVYDLGIRVMSAEGRPLGSFDASTVLGTESQSPGDVLVTYVIEQFHFILAQGPAQYDIQIYWKKDSKIYARARISLPSREQLMAIRRANELRDAQRGRVPPPQYPPQGYGAPPPPQYPQPQYQPPPQAWGAPPHGYVPAPGYAPPAPPQGVGGPSERELALMQELAASRGSYGDFAREMLSRAQQAPVGITQEEMRLRVENAQLKERLAVAGMPQAQPAAAAQPQAPPATLAGAAPILDPVRNKLEAMVGTMLQTTVGHVAKSVERAILAGFGAAPGREPEGLGAPPLVAEPVAPEPEDHKPYHTVPLSAKWGNGSPVVFTASKEDGKIDWQGAAMENPIVSETGMQIAKTIGDAVAIGIQKMSGIQFEKPPEVVDSIPRRAVDGTPRTPEERPAPPQPAPSAPNGGRPAWPPQI